MIVFQTEKLECWDRFKVKWKGMVGLGWVGFDIDMQWKTIVKRVVVKIDR